jgi:hypothetical protein
MSVQRDFNLHLAISRTIAIAKSRMANHSPMLIAHRCLLAHLCFVIFISTIFFRRSKYNCLAPAPMLVLVQNSNQFDLQKGYLRGRPLCNTD